MVSTSVQQLNFHKAINILDSNAYYISHFNILGCHHIPGHANFKKSLWHCVHYYTV